MEFTLLTWYFYIESFQKSMFPSLADDSAFMFQHHPKKISLDNFLFLQFCDRSLSQNSSVLPEEEDEKSCSDSEACRHKLVVDQPGVSTVVVFQKRQPA